MSQKGKVFYNGRFAGIIEKTDNSDYIFTYDDEYYIDPSTESISLSLPKSKKTHHSTVTFSIFLGTSKRRNKQRNPMQGIKDR